MIQIVSAKIKGKNVTSKRWVWQKKILIYSNLLPIIDGMINQ